MAVAAPLPEEEPVMTHTFMFMAEFRGVEPTA
jgi:hypothetical protein